MSKKTYQNQKKIGSVQNDKMAFNLYQDLIDLP